MKCEYIIRNGNPVLTVFFSGWGGEKKLFDRYVPENSDFLLCHDYRSLDFDRSCMEGYGKVRLVAWSMGVWAAGRVLQDVRTDFLEKIAVNGTMRPVDDRYGIPEQVFRGTLDRMDDAVLRKFRLRMCGSAENYASFMAHGPERTAGELKDELASLYLGVSAFPESSFMWTHALAGRNDRIFPAANQYAAWTEAGVPVEMYDEGHYSELLFRKAIECR